MGYTMVYGIIKLINFAHGEIYMMGAFFALTFLSSGHIPFPVAFLLSVACSGLLVVIIDMGAYRPLRCAEAVGSDHGDRSSLSFSRIWQERYGEHGPSPSHPDMSPISSGELPLARGVTITNLQIFIFATAFILMLGLHLIIKKTKIGRAMRACAQDQIAAKLMGVDVNRVVSFTFAIGSSLAGVAGILVAMYYNAVYPTMGYLAVVKAFAAAVLGGIASVPGAMIDAMIQGMGEIFGAAYVSSQYRDGIACAIMILFIIFRPSGILGKGEVERV